MAKSEMLAMHIAEGQTQLTKRVQEWAVDVQVSRNHEGISTNNDRYLICARGHGLPDIAHLLCGPYVGIVLNDKSLQPQKMWTTPSRKDALILFGILLQKKVSCWVFTSSLDKTRGWSD